MVNKNRTYGLSNPLQETNPLTIKAQRIPTAADIGYDVGTIWISIPTNQAYIMTSVAAGAANWALSSPGASDVDTLTGDGGGAISPVAGNIILAGGTNITTAGAGNTITSNLNAAITLATSVTSPVYTAAAADAVLLAGGVNDVVVRLGDNAGATFFRVQDSDSADVYTVDSDGAHTAFAGLVVTGVLTQTAGAVNIGMDNLGSAINIGGGNVIKALAIGGGAAAHTIAIGSAAAGAIAVDSAAGVSIDGATASNFTVTGAAADLTLGATGGSINIVATEADAQAILIDASDATGGIDIDCGSGGLDILATAGAFSIDGELASNITVTSAGLDLSLQGVGCAVNMTSTQAENDAIFIEASAANGGVQISAGTGGILIGNQVDCTGITLGLNAPTATRDITIGGGTVVTAAVTDTISIAGGGATTNANSIKTLNLNTGGVAVGEVLTNMATGNVTSGTHTTAIATGDRAAGAMVLDLMTGTGTMTANLGNADALTTFNIDAITAINDDVNAAFSACTGTSTGAVTLGAIANSGAMILQSSTTIDIDAAGAMTMNSTAGTINIGNDDIDQNMGFGTDGERVVTVGSTNGAAQLVLQGGTAGITMTGTVDDMTANFVRETGDAITFRASPIAQSILDTCVIPTGGAATTDLLAFENGMIMEQFIIGAQTILAPRMGAAALGLTVSCDLTTAVGKEYNFGAARTSSKHSFTIGTSPAFYMQLRFTCNDVSTLEPAYFGFRITAANNAAYGNYTDFACYGVNDGVAPGDCVISTNLNGAGQVDTDTNDAWVDGTTHTLRINVSAAGVVTFLFDGGAPTATQAFTFDNGDVVHPFWTHLYNATVAAGDEVYWESMEVGFQ